jgi:arylsulfatase A-like enzyme
MKTILILMDSLNRNYLHAYNRSADVLTPNIDNFFSSSVIFDNHFIGSAPCMPARRDIFTGRLNFLERSWGGIEPFDITLMQCLRNKGVFTHLCTDHTHYFELGGEGYAFLFDTWDYYRGQEYDKWVSRVNKPEVDHSAYGKKSAQYLLNRKRFISDAEFPSPRTAAATCQWLLDNRDADNFFLVSEMFDPHEPFDASPEFFDLYPEEYSGREFNWSSYAPVTEPPEAVKHLQRCYKATLSMADKWFGKIIDTLKQTGSYDDTMIIFTTDHGHLLGEHNFTGKNLTHAYNELAHIPLCIKRPQEREAGRRIAALTQNIDIMPTVLEHHGIEVPRTVLGNSLLRIMRGESEGRSALIYGWFGRAVNVTDGRYTYFKAPAGRENRPLYIYASIASTLWRYYGNEYADTIDMGRFLKYTNYPVYKITPRPDEATGNIEYIMKNELYDIKHDHDQLHPLDNPEIEAGMLRLMREQMQWAGSPPEQFERLGINIPE